MRARIVITAAAALLLAALTARAEANVGEIDDRATDPADSEAAAGTVDAAAKGFEYTLDVSQAPDLKEWAETRLRPEMDKWYPILRDCLASDGFTAPKTFSVRIKPMEGVAATSDTTVVVVV